VDGGVRLLFCPVRMKPWTGALLRREARRVPAVRFWRELRFRLPRSTPSRATRTTTSCSPSKAARNQRLRSGLLGNLRLGL